MIDIIYITQNRLQLTRQTLPRLAEYKDFFNIHIYDNASGEETDYYLADFCGDEIELTFNDVNMGISKLTKDFWLKSQSDIIGKIDNDIMLPESKDWVDRILNIFKRYPRLAIVGLWHFNSTDDEIERAGRFASDGLLLQEYVGGNYFARRKALLDNKLFGNTVWGWTEFQKELRWNGWMIGYAWPPIKIIHLEDGNEDKNNRIRRGYGQDKAKYIDKLDREWFFGREVNL